MSTSPFVTVMRSLNYTHIVEGFSDDLVEAYDSMKLPRIEIRLKAISESFDKQVETAKNINNFSKTDSIKQLSEKLNEINKFSETRYESRAFKPEPASSDPPAEDKPIETN